MLVYRQLVYRQLVCRQPVCKLGDAGTDVEVADQGKVSRALEVTRVARRGHLLRVLREVGVVSAKPATREGAVEFRQSLEELGTTFLKLGQLLSSRPDLLPDVYIRELDRLTDVRRRCRSARCVR